MADDGVKYCVVCGQGSTRTDWIRKSGEFVACDNHTVEEMQKAIAKAKPAAAPAKAAEPVKTNGGTEAAPATSAVQVPTVK